MIAWVKEDRSIECSPTRDTPASFSSKGYLIIICRPFYNCLGCQYGSKVSQGAKIRNRYNQVPHLTQETNGKVTNSQLDITKREPRGQPFPAVDHKAHINRRAQIQDRTKT